MGNTLQRRVFTALILRKKDLGAEANETEGGGPTCAASAKSPMLEKGIELRNTVHTGLEEEALPSALAAVRRKRTAAPGEGGGRGKRGKEPAPGRPPAVCKGKVRSCNHLQFSPEFEKIGGILELDEANLEYAFLQAPRGLSPGEEQINGEGSRSDLVRP